MTVRLSRKRKTWLRRHVPLGVVMDPVVLGSPASRWGRASFIAERGHSKRLWRNLWFIWNPGGKAEWRGGRFVRTLAWFKGQERRLQKRLREER